jgi:hypothetical protein
LTQLFKPFSALYGEQLIVLQYLPHMGELIAHCRRKLTSNLEAGLVGCLALLRHIIPFMPDNTLMDQLQVRKLDAFSHELHDVCSGLLLSTVKFACFIGCNFENHPPPCYYKNGIPFWMGCSYGSYNKIL